MVNEVNDLLQKVKNFVPKSEKEVEEFRLAFLGKKGKISALFAAFKSVPNEKKKEFGQAINMLKQNSQAKIDKYKHFFKTDPKQEEIELTKPVNLGFLGSRHPISLIRKSKKENQRNYFIIVIF